MKWCDTHRIRYHAEDGECPLCSSRATHDLDGGARRAEA